MTKKEATEYYSFASPEKVKKLGQYFTKEYVADFMRNWVIKNGPKTILDPAVGNGIFLKGLKDVKRKGYDIDDGIIAFFKKRVDMDYDIEISDFLIGKWNERYDAIICNPPYNRFQTLDNRADVFNEFRYNLNFQISGYTNQYSLFLLKATYLLKDKGRLVFIIPSEFLNSGYGTYIKDYLIRLKCLKAIISFNNESDVFDDVLTTSCLIFLEKSNLKGTDFYNVSSKEEFESIDVDGDNNLAGKITVPYSDLDPNIKWSKYLDPTVQKQFKNTIQFSKFASAKRGIATGDNDYFVLNEEERTRYELDKRSIYLCATKSNDYKKCICSETTISQLIKAGKRCYLFDGSLHEDEANKKYVALGVQRGVDKKYLTSHRNPWYSSEPKEPSPIWINVFSREKLKVIRNVANIKNLTTFHSLFLNKGKEKYTNILFCYLLTPIGQQILYMNKRVYGGGLSKFEPNDINKACILNLEILSETDASKIEDIYLKILKNGNCDKTTIDELNRIFSTYLV